jgi:hypothetical protein
MPGALQLELRSGLGRQHRERRDLNLGVGAIKLRAGLEEGDDVE